MMPLLRPLFRNQTLRKRNRRPAASVPYGRRLAFENLEPRAMLSATLLNTPTWLERGPAPIHNSTSVDLNGNGDGDFADVAVGAIQAIAVDPTNANHVFVGTVNGGIWETGNVNATNPVWGTTTDQLPSLAISAIAINPANTNHVYAGTGSLSSDNLEGGQPVGLYRSFDGGTTWTQLGFDTFHGLQIQSIVPTSLRTIFVAASPPESRGSGAGGGVYRSDDFGVSWVRLSGTSGTFLPNAPATDLVSFAVNSTTVGFYAAVPFSGIFRSTDGGARWQNITNNLSSSIASAFQIDLSISPVSGQPVYAGLLGSGGHLINVFRSARGTDGIDNNGNFLIDEPAEATWQAIAHTPPAIGIDNGTFHFAILADSTLNDVVYIGGSGELESGVSRLFRGNSSTQTWTPLSQPVASNTAPHPDVRDLVFSGSSILRADDGGIYRLVNPRGISILPPTVWQSAIGNLRNSEVISVALDDQNNDFTADDVILAGIFDNGIDQRSATGQWTEIFGGDGLIVQAFDAGTPTDYAATQFSVGSRIDNGFPPRVNGAPLNTFLTPQFDPTIPFKVAYQVHARDPNRVLTGTRERLYESFDRQNSVTSIGGVDNSGTFPASKPVPGLTGLVLSMAYGSIANPEIAYVGTDTGDIFVRSTAGGAFVKTHFSAAVIANEGSGSTHSPLDIVLDTNKPQLAYAVTNSGVYMTQNMFDWQPITDDLAGLTLPGSELNLRSIALVNDDTTSITDDVILVGGLGGVFRRKVAAPAGPKWSEYGQRLPNTLVSDIEYDARSNTLAAATLGRGVWTISSVRSTIGLESRLQVNGTTGVDTIRIVRNVNNPSLLDVFFNNTTSKPSITVQLSVVQSIHVSGGNGADNLQIQSSGGIVSIPNGIEFLGGNDNSFDTLVLNNSSDTNGATGVIFSGGSIKGSLVGPLTFSGVEGISIFLGSGNDNFDGSETSVPLTLVGGRGADILRGGSGNDTLIGVDGVWGNDKLFGGPGNDTALIDPFDFFDGDGGKDGVDFYGTPGNDHIVVSRQVGPDGVQAVIGLNKQTQVFNYVNGETINVYAGAGNDHVVMDESAGSHWQAQFFGEQGNDHLYGGAMDDLLDGGPGNDFLDGGGGDNTLVGGGGHDLLRNGHPPLVSLSIAAASTATPVAAGTSTKSSLARLVQAPVQFDNRSRLLELSRIDSSLASLASFYQELDDKDATQSRAALLERNTHSNDLDEELLDALLSSFLSKEIGSTIGTVDNTFATYFSAT